MRSQLEMKDYLVELCARYCYGISYDGYSYAYISGDGGGTVARLTFDCAPVNTGDYMRGNADPSLIAKVDFIGTDDLVTIYTLLLQYESYRVHYRRR